LLYILKHSLFWRTFCENCPEFSATSSEFGVSLSERGECVCEWGGAVLSSSGMTLPGWNTSSTTYSETLWATRLSSHVRFPVCTMEVMRKKWGTTDKQPRIHIHAPSLLTMLSLFQCPLNNKVSERALEVLCAGREKKHSKVMTPNGWPKWLF
jgi:hypothetical protein